jgi:hypothetical protein
MRTKAAMRVGQQPVFAVVAGPDNLQLIDSETFSQSSKYEPYLGTIHLNERWAAIGRD